MKEAKAAILERVNRSQSSKAYVELAANRKEQVGSGMRGDKVRTYRFNDNLVKDHQSDRQASIDKVMAGNFQLLWR